MVSSRAAACAAAARASAAAMTAADADCAACVCADIHDCNKSAHGPGCGGAATAMGGGGLAAGAAAAAATGGTAGAGAGACGGGGRTTRRFATTRGFFAMAALAERIASSNVFICSAARPLPCDLEGTALVEPPAVDLRRRGTGDASPANRGASDGRSPRRLARAAAVMDAKAADDVVCTSAAAELTSASSVCSSS